MEDPVQTFCDLIVKYDSDKGANAKAIGDFPVSERGVPINYNLVKGIDVSNSEKSIGTIYKRLARSTHSDKTKNGTDDFKNLSNAVEALREDPNGIIKVLEKLLEMQTPTTIGESSATPRANFNVLYSNPREYEWRPFTQRNADAAAAAASAAKRKEQEEFDKKRKSDYQSSNEDDSASLYFETAMNAFIREYINFLTLDPSKRQTTGEIDPYFYAKNKIENTYPGVTILPFDGDNEETFNANIKMYLSKIPGSQLPSFEGKFEAVKSYNVKRTATKEEKQDAFARFDRNIAEDKLNSSKRRTDSKYQSSTFAYPIPTIPKKKSGGSKTKAKRNKSKRKRSRKTRRTRR